MATTQKHPKNVLAVIDWYKKNKGKDDVAAITRLFHPPPGPPSQVQLVMEALTLQGFEAGRQFQYDLDAAGRNLAVDLCSVAMKREVYGHLPYGTLDRVSAHLSSTTAPGDSRHYMDEPPPPTLCLDDTVGSGHLCRRPKGHAGDHIGGGLRW